MKHRILLSILLILAIPAMALAQANFSDVNETTKYRESILALANAGVIRGYPDGTFRPISPLHRAELVQLILQAEEKTIERNLPPCFSDVRDKTQWFYNPLCTAYKLNIAQGYPDGTFKPGNTVNRAEAVALLCRTQEWDVPANFDAPFSDVPKTQWFAPCIAYAKSAGYLAEISKKSKIFGPGAEMKRGVFSELLYESLKAKNSPVLLRSATPEPIFMDNGATPETITATISELEQGMLDLVNQERQAQGLQAVVWSDELSNVAQGHSNDMVSRGFFDHVNPDGESPDDRRLEGGITTLVGENLAKAPSLASAHEGLMNSPPHRANILNPEWERLGIGVAKDADGYLLFTQLFSTLPITGNELTSTKNRLLTKMNDSRAQAGLSALLVSSGLESVATGWSEKMAQERFFAMEALDGQKLLDLMQASVSATYYQASIYQTNQLQESFDDVVLEDETVYLNARLRRVGLGFAVDPAGLIKLSVLYTD